MDISNPYAYRHRADPHALYDAMRQHGPALRYDHLWDMRPLWFITDYALANRILKGDETVKDVANVPGARPVTSSGSPYDMVFNHMLYKDPPEHTRLRSVVHKAFTPRRVAAMHADIDATSRQLLNDITADSFDLIDRFAFPLPLTVIASLLGIPLDMRDTFRRWVDTLLFAQDFETGNLAAVEFFQYFHALFDELRAHPQDTLLSDIVHGTEQGDALDGEELMGMVFLLLTAGHETTVNLIGNGMLALMQHPDQYDRLQQQPDLLPTAVEELLRYDGPVEVTTRRLAAKSIDIGGQTIGVGDGVAVALVAANRDPQVFQLPHQLDIARQPNKHIAFVAGIHYCVGAPLARIEGNIAFGHLMTHFERLELATTPEALEWNDSLILHGMKSLPVRVTG